MEICENFQKCVNLLLPEYVGSFLLLLYSWAEILTLIGLICSLGRGQQQRKTLLWAFASALIYYHIKCKDIYLKYIECAKTCEDKLN